MLKLRSRVRGRLDTCTFDSVSGWASSPESPNSVTEVAIFVNGELRQRVPADILREDVKAEKLHATGKCGFAMRFPASEFLTIGDRVEVRVMPGGLQLVNSPQTIRTYQKSHNKNFFFLHIPKTAGTAFRHALVENFIPEKTFPTAADFDANEGLYPSLFGETRKGKYADMELFLGHYPFAVKHLLAEQVEVIAFFRDPVERAVSNLLHVKSMWPKLREKSLQEIVDNPSQCFSQIYNSQVWFLSDLTWEARLPYFHAVGPKGRNLENALANLEKISFIGLTEEYDASLQMLQIKYGFRLSSSKLNITKATEKANISPEVIDKIAEFNQQDIVLYERAKQLFATQRVALGLDT